MKPITDRPAVFRFKVDMQAEECRLHLIPSENVDYGPSELFIPKAIRLFAPSNQQVKIERVHAGDDRQSDQPVESRIAASETGLLAASLYAKILRLPPQPLITSSLFSGSVSPIACDVVPKGAFLCIHLRSPAAGTVTVEGEVLGSVMPMAVADDLDEDEAAFWNEDSIVADPPESLFERCRRWFGEGILLGMKDKIQQMMNPREESLAEDLGIPPRREGIRDRLRQLIIHSIAVADLSQTAILRLVDASLGRIEGHLPPSGQVILPFGAHAIKPGESMRFVSESQVGFRPKMLKIPAHVACQVDIVDIKVGKNSQFIVAAPVPGTAFALDNGQLVELHMDDASPGTKISIEVVNRQADAVVFSAVMIGETLPWSAFKRE